MERLENSLLRLVRAAVEACAQLISTKIERAVGKLAERADKSGPVPGAALRAARAALLGKSPVWAAIKGAIAGMSWQTKLILVAAMILLPILLVVLGVVLLLVLIVRAVVVAFRAATQRG
ncbi:hypothetical protein [Saccharopolyspora elongata]|uniref:Uncharacterized protein n=1 Tax=Saccharopolyspora elongata TaxID=2530387 RepID=A0A4R4Z2A1_9PSEU|nr:hypothetical protein [Saccharopolyspora elongata]TDD50162.1 hypothetical protein E1288_18330 [Saccharopolyspora elongata]